MSTTTSTSSNTSACSSRSSSPVPAPSLSTRSQSVISFMQLDSPAATTSELGYFETARLCKTPVEQSFKPKLLQKVRNLLEAEKRPAESEMAAEREIIQTCTTPNKPFLQNNEPLLSSPNHLKSPTRISIYNGSKLNPDSEPIRRSEEYVAMAAAAIAASNTPLLPTPLPLPPPPPCSSPNSSTRSSPFLPPTSALPALNSPLIAQRLGRKRKLSEDLSMAWDNQLVKRRAAMAAAVAAAAAANSGSGSPNTAAGASVYWQTPTFTPLDNGSLLCSAFPFNTSSPHMRPIKATQQSSSLSSQSAPGTPSGILLGGGGGRSNSSNEKLPASSSRLPLSAGIGLTSGFFSRLTLDESTLATVTKGEEDGGEEEVIGDKSTL